MVNRKPVSVTLDPKILAEIDRLCSETDRTRSWLIERAVLHYLIEVAELENALSNVNDPPEYFITEDELIKKLGL
jgi:predicted transcriptional regulator